MRQSEERLGSNKWDPKPYLNIAQVNEEGSDDDDDSDSDNEDVQLNIQREPLLSFKPKEKHTHDMNYFVPDFGTDSAIRDTLENEAEAETVTGHKWVYVPKNLRDEDYERDYKVPNFGQDSDIK